MIDFLVVGAGNIGSTTAYYLFEKGYNIVVVDRDPGKIRRIRERIGLQAVKASIGSDEYFKLVSRSRIVVLALPSTIGYRALKETIEAGARKIVDVSFMPENPLTLNGYAKEKNSTVIVDAGLAPGLSNLFIGYAYGQLDTVREAVVYVGGIAEDPECPLGLAGTWNTRDLLEEYIRPARIVVEGEVKSIDPLSEYGETHIPGIGVFEYFPSDGLRTMLETLKPLPQFMAEYTLRWPGHIEVMKKLRDLGFLEPIGVRIGLCETDAIEYTATILASKLVECQRDRVVMYVDVIGGKNNKRIEYELILDQPYDTVKQITAMAKTTSTTQACTAIQLLEEKIRVDQGINAMETIGLDKENYKSIMECIRGEIENIHTYTRIEE